MLEIHVSLKCDPTGPLESQAERTNSEGKKKKQFDNWNWDCSEALWHVGETGNLRKTDAYE